MAQTVTMLIHLFFTLLSLSFLQSNALISNGFRLKLTHRDSPQSPLYQPNLSDFERFKKNVDISKARASYLHQLIETTGNGNSRLKKNPLWLSMIYHDPIYTVEIGLGTPVVNRTLVFDTGSHVTWTQCKPCKRCFAQAQPLFDISQSRSYRIMSRENKLAKDFKCNKFGCMYAVKYYSGQSSAGVLAVEDFTFQTKAARVSRRVPGLVFGCGTNNNADFGPRKVISGILGMDKRPISFARQLGGLIQERFSYCLPAISNSNTKQSYIKFGEEATIPRQNARRTPFLQTMSNALYALNLTGISIGGHKLGVKQQATFPEVCIIDSGSSISLLKTKTYYAVKAFVITYLAKFNTVRRLMGKKVPAGMICYTYPEGFKNFPSLIFHFQGADFDVPPQNLFLFKEKVFCLAAMESKDVTILGAHQQRNVRIVYDLKSEMLSFASEDCSRDAV